MKKQRSLSVIIDGTLFLIINLILGLERRHIRNISIEIICNEFIKIISESFPDKPMAEPLFKNVTLNYLKKIISLGIIKGLIGSRTENSQQFYFITAEFKEHFKAKKKLRLKEQKNLKFN